MLRGFRIEWWCTLLWLSALVAAACARPPETPIRQPLVTIPVVNNVSNLNGTAIPAGRYIWFSSVMKVSGVGSQPVHLYFNRSKIQFTAGGTPYSITVPDSEITIDPAAASASTTFDAASQTWKTVLPSPWSGNAFLGGVSFPVPVNLPGGINPVTWSASFESDAAISVNWQWAAAVYTSFSADHDALGVKPLDGSAKNPYPNSDHAGTPEAWKSFVVGGARGGGGSNYTGSLSGTVSVIPVQACAGVTCPAPDQCHLPGTCDPRSGVCSNPPGPDGGSCGGDPCQGVMVDDGNPCTVDSCDATGVHHVPAAAGTSCADGDVCNGAETCDGTGACVAGPPLPVDDDNACTADSCDPVMGVQHASAAAGTSCADGNPCNGGETCDGAGTCLPGSPTPPAPLTPGPCQVVACSQEQGWFLDAAPAGTSCADATVCNGAELCDAMGGCLPGTPLVVDDANACTVDSCDPVAGVQNDPAAAGTSCADDNPCNGAETCDGAGACVAGSPTPPAPLTPAACQVIACTQELGWFLATAPAGTSCADATVCNGDELCDAIGGCLPGTPLTVDDDNPCTADACDASGGVSHTLLADGASCSDGNACNGAETCQQGACTPGTPPPPPSPMTGSDLCHVATCDPASGWSLERKPAGSSCADGNACNGAETCDALGACLAGAPPVVEDGNPCTVDSCDPATGVHHDPADEGTVCGAGNVCGEVPRNTCQAGQCLPEGQLIAYSANDYRYQIYPSTSVPADYYALVFDDSDFSVGSAVFGSGGSCDVQHRVQTFWPTNTDLVIRRHVNVPDGTGDLHLRVAIDNDVEVYFNGTAITNGLKSHEGCADVNQLEFEIPKALVHAGDNLLAIRARDRGVEAALDLYLYGDAPKGVPAGPLDDLNPCTYDTCDPVTGVKHTALPDGSSCFDGTICNGLERCMAGICQPGTPLVLNDNNPCTVDTCHPVNGVRHDNAPAGASCSDGNVCNGTETCNASGACLSGNPPSFDDNNQCTADSCSAEGGIVHVVVPDGTPCSLGACLGGICGPACVPPPDGLVSWWTGDGNTFDLRSNNHAIVGLGTAAFTAGRVGQAFQFSGTSYLQVPSTPALAPAAITLSGWIRPTFTSRPAARGDLDTVIEKYDGRANGYALFVAMDNNFFGYSDAPLSVPRGTPGFYLNVGGTAIQLMASRTIPNDNAFHHLAATYEGSIMALYIDGQEVARRNVSGPVQHSATDVFIGVENTFRQRTARAAIDEVQIYNRALSPEDVAAVVFAAAAGNCKPGLAAVNAAPRVNAGPDRTILLPTSTASLTGTVTDDGLPGPSVTLAWSVVSGPGSVTFSAPAAGSTNVTFTAAGAYVLRLTASDGALAASDDVLVTVNPEGMNQPPVVNCGPDRTLRIPNNTFVFASVLCQVSDDGLPSGTRTSQWIQVSGPSSSFGEAEETLMSAVLFGQGIYVFRQTVSDGALSASDDVTITVLPANNPPVVNAGPDQNVALRPGVATLSGSATDDGIPAGSVLTYQWTQQSGPGGAVIQSPAAASTTVTFTAVGTYVFRLTASDSASTGFDDLTVVVQGNVAPSVNAGPDQTIMLPTRTATLAGTVTDDGKPAGAAVAIRWEALSGPGLVSFADPFAAATTATFDAPGTYVLRLGANDTDLAASDTINVTIQALPPSGDAPTVAITSPGDLTTVTAPIEVRGTVTSDSLLAWRLELRDKSLGDDWRPISTGTTTVSDAVLGTFDPSLLLNGIYQLRLVATDTAGRTASTPEDQPALNVRGNFKVGQFSLSFLELSVPVSGIPIQLLRNYDSRDTRNGDFGYGWSLDASGVRVTESGKMGRAWTTVRQPGFFPVFCVQATRGKHVTVTASGGKVYEFEAVIDDGCETFFEPSVVTVGFRALGGTTATLEPQDGGTVLFSEGQLLDANAQVYDPHTYVLTLLNGEKLVVADRTAPSGPGLQSITDPNGNSVTFSRSGITHSSGAGLVITRDSQSRITAIVDPVGQRYTYAYDLDGNLASATDPAGNVTRFTYDPAQPHYLRDILDPRGTRAIRNSYAPDGRLASTTDAAGKVTTYTHDLSARQEVVVDRSGGTTTLEYDVRGNVIQETDPEGGITTRTFDLHDNMTSMTDPNGHTWSHEFDDRDLEIKTIDPLGKETTRTYHPLGKVLTEKDPLGHTKTNGYDIFGNLVSSKDALDNTTTYAYTPDGANLRTVTDPAGKVTSYFYDRYGFMTSSRDRLENVTTYTNDANGRRLTETRTRTTPSGTQTLVTKFTYDGNGRVTKTENPDGSVVKTTYNSIGQVATTVDALGRTTAMTYDDLGQLIKTTYPDGKFEETTYDESGRRSSSTDAAGRVTSYEYDRMGRLVKTTLPDGAVTTMGYDPGGRQTSATDARGKVTTYGYDDAGRRTTVTDPLDHTTTYGYDDAGRNTSIRDARGFTTSFTYDDTDRRTKITYPDTRETATAYDKLGRRTSETDQAGRTTSFEYDVEGRLLTVTDALEHVTTYAYDEVGNRVSQTDANTHETKFEYDQMGRQTRRTLPDNKFESRVYDAQGRVGSRTDFMGRKTTFQYDQRDRLTLKTYPDTTMVSFTYTATGRRLTAVDSRGTTSYTYDERDRPTQLTYPDGRKLNYGYDAQGNRTSLKATIGSTVLTTGYAYDDAGHLTTVTDPDDRVYSYGYNENGAPTSLAQPNGVTTTYEYDDLNRLTNMVSKIGSTTLASYTYTLGPTGLRTRVDELNGISRAYAYDRLYRLTSETVTGTGGGDYGKTFAYDSVGNRQSQVTTGPGASTVTYTHDSRDRLLTDMSATYSWDDDGNLLSKSSGDSYAWDFDDRLTKVTKPDGTGVEHAYDADGNRVRTTVTPPAGATAVTEYLVDTTGALSQVVVETNGSGSLGAYYVRAGDDLLAVRRAPVLACYLQDGLRSVRGVADAAGTVTETKTYSAFGETIDGTNSQSYGFAGEAFEPISGLSYHRARWMNPAMGGFLSRDPFQGWSRDPRSLNGYCYATNNPVNIVDPNGRVAVSLGNIVGALVVLGVVAEVGLFTYNKALRSRGRSELPRDLANTPEMLAAYGTDGSPRDFDQGVGALIHYWWSQEPRIQETFKIAAAFRNSNYRASQDTRVAVAEHYLYGLGEFFEKQTALWGRVRTGGYSTIKQVSPDLLPPALGYPPSPYAANDSAWYNQAIFGLGTNDVPIECWIVDQKRGLNLNGQVPSQCSWPAKRR